MPRLGGVGVLGGGVAPPPAAPLGTDGLVGASGGVDCIGAARPAAEAFAIGALGGTGSLAHALSNSASPEAKFSQLSRFSTQDLDEQGRRGEEWRRLPGTAQAER